MEGKYKTDDLVEFLDYVNGGICLVTGTVSKVQNMNDGEQHLTVKGSTKSGIHVVTLTSSYNKSLSYATYL